MAYRQRRMQIDNGNLGFRKGFKKRISENRHKPSTDYQVWLVGQDNGSQILVVFCSGVVCEFLSVGYQITWRKISVSVVSQVGE